MALEDSCTFLVAQPASYEVATVEEVKELLGEPDVYAKIDGLRRALMAMLTGVDMSGILMNVIRGCVTVEDHTLKKMLMLYWESVRKRGPDGKLLQELILVW